MPLELAAPDEAALQGALAVLTGIEQEFDLGGDDREVECYCNSPCCQGYRYESGSERWNECWAPGWELDWDGGYAEARSDGPTPLGAQRDAWGQLQSHVIHELDCEGSWDTSWHVHVNVDPDIGPAVCPRALTKAWFAMRDEAYLLVDSSNRTSSNWCKPLGWRRTIERGWLPPEMTKGAELNRDTDLGTIELRLWDSTTSARLIERRLDFLQRWIAAAMTVEQQEARDRAASHALAAAF